MNMQKLMAQAQQMQKSINQKKEKVESMEFSESTDLFDVVLTGDKKVKSVKIKADKIESDDIEILEDMIILAVNNAIKKIDAEFEKELGAYGQSLNGLF